MLALTQCWYTRAHVPEGRAHRESDNSYSSYCRHCGRPIVSRKKQSWQLADGIDLTELAQKAGPRFLYLLDVTDDLILARFTVSHLDGEEAIEAYKEELREKHNADTPESDVMLKDSADNH